MKNKGIKMKNRHVLPDVPAMWYGHPSAVCYIGSVLRLMAYIGDPVDEDELYALSGVGLCFPWQYASSCDEVGLIAEIPSRTFGAFGYESEYLVGEAVQDKSLCLAKIKASIDRGCPVIGFGITVQMPMACLIVGYDEGGLYTRSFWPPEGCRHDAGEYFYSADWYENCTALLFVGQKTKEKLTGAQAYGRVTEWALFYRCCQRTVRQNGQDIYLNQYAYDAMVDWLLDDGEWNDPIEGGKEQYLKQCGLLLMQHYRYHLYEYLKKLDAAFPGLVNQPAFAALERMSAAVPGAHTSDLWLHEAVDPALADFSAMRSRSLREKAAAYVRLLKAYDDSIQWTLFMPEMVRHQAQGFQVDLEYREYPAFRFIGAELPPGDHQARAALFKKLDEMPEYKFSFDYDLLFMHHNGLTVDQPWHGVWGRFMKAQTPVPDGYISIDFVPYDLPVVGAPYYARFAFARFCGDREALHAREGYDSDAMYDITRNIILGHGVNIPYPEKYWTAEVFMDGCEQDSTGYLFSVGFWDHEPK